MRLTDAPVPAAPVGRRHARFHTLTVAEVRPLTADAIEVTFDVPDELADAYSYAAGQYIAIRADLDGEQVRRTYSICQAPARRSLKVGIKRDMGGLFSPWAVDHLAPGMSLDVMSPEGLFVSHRAPGQGGRVVGVAAGSGITPMMSLVEQTLGSDAESTFDLVYSNRTTIDAMFVDELADLKDRYPTRLALHHVLTRERRGSELLSGRLDVDRFRRIVTALIGPDDVAEWFLCGPFEVVQMCRDVLTELGVPRERVRHELFTTGRADRPTAPRGAPPASGGPGGPDGSGGESCSIAFRLDSTTATVKTPAGARESVLNAALRVRGDVPFACTNGVCGTCRAKLVSGTVEMTENYALEPEELARGYILTCQAIPTSKEITVDYDS
ncbi:1,2-phenylacetyl-CoA epoxidase subunit PaaE [Promicromonospora sp. NPDC057138]|uniref:1,2-phenylacetyl-CoA epoxidase subunit PaaE n=1 Tax=Promicromonospora sp. NPDC057138 TaxID=3346031 RepID=UPI003638988B